MAADGVLVNHDSGQRASFNDPSPQVASTVPVVDTGSAYDIMKIWLVPWRILPAKL